MKRQSTGRGWAPTLLLGFAIASLAAATMTSYVIIGQDAGREAQVENEIEPPVLTQAPEVAEPIVLPAPSEQPAPLPGTSIDETSVPDASAPAVVAQAPAPTETTDDEPESFEGGLEGDSGSNDDSVGGTVSDVLDRGQVGPSAGSDGDSPDDGEPNDSDDGSDDESKGKGKGHDGSVESHQGGMSLNEDKDKSDDDAASHEKNDGSKSKGKSASKGKSKSKGKSESSKSKGKSKSKGTKHHGSIKGAKDDDDQVLIEEDDDDIDKGNGKNKDSVSDDSETSGADSGDSDSGDSGSGDE